MTNTGKKVGYLKGLLEGMRFDESDANGKLLHGIIEVLGDLSDRVETIDELLDDLNDYVESIDDDLSALEGEQDGAPSFNFMDDEDDVDFDDDFDDGEDQLHLLRTEPSDAPTPAEVDSLAAALCPECKRMFFVHLTDPEGSTYTCPHCSIAAITPIPVTPENTPVVSHDGQVG